MSASSENTYTISITNSAFSKYITCYSVHAHSPTTDIITFLKDVRNMLEEVSASELALKRSIKVWFCLVVLFDEIIGDQIVQTERRAYFATNFHTCLNNGDIPELVDSAFRHIMHSADTFEERGSSIVLTGIDRLDLHVAAYEPLNGSSYVELPPFLRRKHAIINPQNTEDNMCFKWCLLAATTPDIRHHRERISHYRNIDSSLDFSKVAYPMEVSKISEFESLNGIAINVYEYDDGLRPVHISSQKSDTLILLLLYEGHYCLISDLDRLLHDQNNHQHRGYYCPFCMIAQYNSRSYKAHVKRCQTKQFTEVKMPSENESTMKFRNYHKTLRSPYVVYADAECFTKSIVSNPTPNPDSSFTSKLHRHQPYMFGCVTSKSCCGSTSFQNYQNFSGEDCAKRFLEYLINASADFQASREMLLNMSTQDEQSFQTAESCYLCNLPLETDRVRDHCHMCGKYRGALHNHCNQSLRLNGDLTVVFHNLRRYDGHLIMKHIGKVCNEFGYSLGCIAKGVEDYITFTLQSNRGRSRIRFIDSCLFLPASLDSLVCSLSDDKFEAVRKFFSPFRDILLRKGVFPYDYVDSPEKLDETQLPSKDDFYSKLTEQGISDEDYQRATDVWNLMQIQSMREYAEMYLKLDVLLTADVFENFRTVAMKTYGLDPCQYVTLPSYAFDGCLKMTGVELELLTDEDMYKFLESGIRGGVSVISHRYAHAKNKYLGTSSGTDEDTFIVDLDKNNLYGHSMSQKLPVGGFEWVDPEDLKLDSYTPSYDYGYILEVDLDYPPHLHDDHNCYPMAPEKLTITDAMVSAYTKRIAEKLNMPVKDVEKLVPNLLPKKNYVVHIENLQYYIQNGLILTKVHRVLRFKQLAWMKPFIDLNTRLRKETLIQFEKDLYKLFNNSVFGKTFENPRKYVNIELVTTRQRLRKIVKKPQFQRCVVFDENLVAFVCSQKVLCLNRPIYIGFVVLELSKLLMYNFHYGYIKVKYGDRAKLLLTDTDSYLYLIQTADFYVDIMNDLDEHFDTSDYDKSHFLYSDKNKKVLGKMKDETAGIPIEEFVGLRSKMYSFRYDDVEHKRAKGVKKAVVKRKIRHDDYASVLQNEEYRMDSMNMIRSYDHDLFTVTQNKRSLCCYDDKRYILPNGIDTLAYGHYRINEM